MAGYTGFQCQLEINECESSPCLNGGTCTDHIGSFSCACGRGYTGQTCRTKVTYVFILKCEAPSSKQRADLKFIDKAREKEDIRSIRRSYWLKWVVLID